MRFNHDPQDLAGSTADYWNEVLAAYRQDQELVAGAQAERRAADGAMLGAMSAAGMGVEFSAPQF